MKLPYFIKYQVLGNMQRKTIQCRTKDGVKHMVNELKNKTMLYFETNADGVDILDIQISS